MKPIMMRVVNPNQTGGISGRTINDNLASCRNIVLDSCVDDEAKRETAILAIDFEKSPSSHTRVKYQNNSSFYFLLFYVCSSDRSEHRTRPVALTPNLT